MDTGIVFRASKLRLPGQGLLGRLQTPEPRELAEAVHDTLRKLAAPDRPRIEKSGTAVEARVRALLHPAAPPVILIFTGGGAMSGSADTTFTGPGYHHFWTECIDGLREALGGDWKIEDTTGYFDEREVQVLKETFNRWLLARAKEWLAKYPSGGGAEGLPFRAVPVHRRFLATPLGLWEREWFDRFVGDAGPRAMARDWFPWWKEKRDAVSWRNLGLCLAWCEVTWERPRADGERAVVQRASTAFARARAADPGLPIPLAIWAELRDLIGEPALPGLAGGSDMDVPRPAGYRRRPLRHALPGGWTVDLPHVFEPERETEAVFEGRSGTRTLHFDAQAGIRTAADPSEAYGTILSDLIQRRGKGRKPWERYDASVEGLAFLGEESRGGKKITLVEGALRANRRVALITCSVEPPEDPAWLRSAWDSLRIASP